MKLKVYEQSESQEGIVHIQLVEQDFGEATLYVCDKAGKIQSGGAIVTISQEGLHVQYGLSPKWGFKMDSNKIALHTKI